MAIIIEEERKANGILNVLGWLVVLGIVIAAIYYIFFVSPEAAIVAPSANLVNIGPISGINLNEQDVLNSAEFLSLKPLVSPSSTIGTVPVGRPNPFVSP